MEDESQQQAATTEEEISRWEELFHQKQAAWAEKEEKYQADLARVWRQHESEKVDMDRRCEQLQQQLVKQQKTADPSTSTVNPQGKGEGGLHPYGPQIQPQEGGKVIPPNPPYA